MSQGSSAHPYEWALKNAVLDLTLLCRIGALKLSMHPCQLLWNEISLLVSGNVDQTLDTSKSCQIKINIVLSLSACLPASGVGRVHVCFHCQLILPRPRFAPVEFVI